MTVTCQSYRPGDRLASGMVMRTGMAFEVRYTGGHGDRLAFVDLRALAVEGGEGNQRLQRLCVLLVGLHLDPIAHVPQRHAEGVIHLEEYVDGEGLRTTAPGQLELTAGNLGGHRDEIFRPRYLE